jgi:hypothetical protein
MLCTCLLYIFVGLLVYPSVLCAAVLGVSIEADSFNQISHTMPDDGHVVLYNKEMKTCEH